MPRTIDAILKNGLENNSGTPIIRVHLADGTGGTATSTQILYYKLSNLELTVRIAPITIGAFEPQETNNIRIERGLLINGVEYTLQSSWYIARQVKRTYYFIELKAHLFNLGYITTAGDDQMDNVLAAFIAQTDTAHHTNTISFLSPDEWWKNIQFLPNGRSLTLNNPDGIVSLLRQKYLAAVCDIGEQDVKIIGGTSVFQLDPAYDFEIDYLDFPEFSYDRQTFGARQYFWRDENNTVHTTGTATDIRHNLGYIESTVTPLQLLNVQNFSFTATLSPPRLDIVNGDFILSVLPFSQPNNSLLSRVYVDEVFDPTHKLPWRMELRAIEWLSNTEGGAMPSTIEAAAPYTPLVTGNFAGILSASDNNLQAAMNTIDDHVHAASGGVTSGPQAFGDNYVITPSIASNNLTIALKTVAGTDPSASDKISFRIGNTKREISAAISTTKNAATNWCNAGGAELATKAIDYFVYLIQETGASAGTKISFSRIPYAKTMNDFVNTTTSEKYIAGNWTNFNTTDEVENIGRFRATLSAGAGYTWSIASALVINRPVYETDWLDWTPAWSGFSSMTITGVTVAIATYKIDMNILHENVTASAFTVGGTPSAIIISTLPFNAINGSLLLAVGFMFGSDAVTVAVFGGCRLQNGTPDKLYWIRHTATNWAAGAGTGLNHAGFYEI